MWLTHAHKRWLMARHCTDILVICSSIVCLFSHFFHIKSLFIFSKITEINFSRAQTDLYISFTGYCKYNNLNYGNAYWHNVWQHWQKISGCLGLLHTSITGKGMNLLLPSFWPFTRYFHAISPLLDFTEINDEKVEWVTIWIRHIPITI